MKNKNSILMLKEARGEEPKPYLRFIARILVT